MEYFVATDGSAVSELAIEHAASDPSVRGTSLEIVHVLTPNAELVVGLKRLGGEKAIQRGKRTLN
jgi:nucleotide-binding universal stress UspA family protein